jgi:transcriptional regulator with XRE-family HTH domain
MRIENPNTDQTVQTEIGRRVARTRLQRNWSQARLAEEAGLGRASTTSSSPTPRATARSSTWAFGSGWTHRHQMTINGKRDDFTLRDLRQVAAAASMKTTRAEQILTEVRDAVAGWPAFAEEAGIDGKRAEEIGATHRLDLPAD